MMMKKTCTWLMLLMLTLHIFMICSVQSYKLDSFENGEKFVVLDFQGDDSKTLNISLPKNASVINASLDITPLLGANATTIFHNGTSANFILNNATMRNGTIGPNEKGFIYIITPDTINEAYLLDNISIRCDGFFPKPRISWNKFSSPENFYDHAAVLDDYRGMLYVYSGMTESGGAKNISDRFLAWDINNNKWHIQSLSIDYPRIHRHSAVWDDASQEMIIYGGLMGQPPIEEINDKFIFVKPEINDSGDINLNIRYGTTALPGRWGHAMAYLPEKRLVYISGGSNYTGSDGGPLNDVWMYDVNGDNLTELPPLPVKLYNHSMILAHTYDSEILCVYGGQTTEGINDKLYILRLGPGNVWKEVNVKGEFAPLRRYSHAALPVDYLNAMMIWGGVGPRKEMLSDAWLYFFDSNEWIKIASDGKIPKQKSHVGAYFHMPKHDLIISSGGLTESKTYPPREEPSDSYIGRFTFVDRGTVITPVIENECGFNGLYVVVSAGIIAKKSLNKEMMKYSIAILNDNGETLLEGLRSGDMISGLSPDIKKIKMKLNIFPSDGSLPIVNMWGISSVYMNFFTSDDSFEKIENLTSDELLHLDKVHLYEDFEDGRYDDSFSVSDGMWNIAYDNQLRQKVLIGSAKNNPGKLTHRFAQEINTRIDLVFEAKLDMGMAQLIVKSTDNRILTEFALGRDVVGNINKNRSQFVYYDYDNNKKYRYELHNFSPPTHWTTYVLRMNMVEGWLELDVNGIKVVHLDSDFIRIVKVREIVLSLNATRRFQTECLWNFVRVETDNIFDKGYAITKPIIPYNGIYGNIFIMSGKDSKNKIVCNISVLDIKNNIILSNLRNGDPIYLSSEEYPALKIRIDMIRKDDILPSLAGIGLGNIFLKNYLDYNTGGPPDMPDDEGTVILAKKPSRMIIVLEKVEIGDSKIYLSISTSLDGKNWSDNIKVSDHYEFTPKGPYIRYKIVWRKGTNNEVPYISMFYMFYYTYSTHAEVISPLIDTRDMNRFTAHIQPIFTKKYGEYRIYIQINDSNKWISTDDDDSISLTSADNIKYKISVRSDGNDSFEIKGIKVELTEGTMPYVRVDVGNDGSVDASFRSYNTTKLYITKPLIEYINEHGYGKIPISVKCNSGKIRIDNLSVIYAMPPIFSKKIEDMKIYEDIPSYSICNLSEYFHDENQSLPLKYDVKVLDSRKFIDAYVNGSFLNIVPKVPNWTGNAKLKVICTNKFLLSSESNTFNLTVVPVNDPPTIGEIPTIKMIEDASEEEIIDINEYINDIDSPKENISFRVISSEEINAWVDELGKIHILTEKDWYGDTEIILYAYDGIDYSKRKIGISVSSVDDPPIVNIAPQYLTLENNEYQGTLYLPVSSDRNDERMSNIIVDVDTPPDKIKVESDSARVKKIEDYKDFKIIHLSYPHMSGKNEDEVTLSISSGTHDIKTSFKIFMVNSTPIKIKEIDYANLYVEMNEDSNLNKVINLKDYFESDDVIFFSEGYDYVISSIDDEGWVNLKIVKNNWSGYDVMALGAVSLKKGLPCSYLPLIVKVLPINDAPVIKEIPSEIKVLANETFKLPLKVMDDGIFNVSTSSKNVKIINDLGNLQLVFNYKEPTDEVVEIYINDGEYERSVNIHISVVDDLPKRTHLKKYLPFILMDEDEKLNDALLSLDDYFIGNLRYELLWDKNANLNASNGELKVTLSKDWYGKEDVCILAFDDSNFISSDILTIYVSSVNDPPIIMKEPANDEIFNDEFYIIKLKWDAEKGGIFYDADSTYLAFGSNNPNVKIFGDYAIFEPNGEGIEKIIFYAYDGKNRISTNSIELRILPVKKITPVLTAENELFPILTLLVILSAGIASGAIFLKKKKKSLHDEAVVKTEAHAAPQPEGVAPVHKDYGEFEVNEIFLIYRDGRLISHLSRQLSDVDEEIMSGMLTAIQDFVKDSLAKKGESAELGSFEYGDNKVILEKSKNLILTVVISGEEPKKFREAMRDQLTSIEAQYAAVLPTWDGDKSHLKGISRFLKDVFKTKGAEEDVSDAKIDIASELEFYEGYVRVKVAVKNKGEMSIMKSAFKLVYDEKVLSLEKIEPEYERKGDEVKLGIIEPREKKTVAFYLDPKICTECYIDGILEYKDARGELHTQKMRRKRVSVVCPIFYTPENINVAMLKRLITEELNRKDSKIFRMPDDMDIEEALHVAKLAIQHHDVRLVREYRENEPYEAEAWFYGETKGRKEKIVLKAGVRGETRTVEFFAASTTSTVITGILSELKNDLNRELEKIKKSPIKAISDDEKRVLRKKKTLLEKYMESEITSGDTDIG